MEGQGRPRRGDVWQEHGLDGHPVGLWLELKSVLAGDKAECGDVDKGHFFGAVVTGVWDCPSASHGPLRYRTSLG